MIQEPLVPGADLAGNDQVFTDTVKTLALLSEETTAVVSRRALDDLRSALWSADLATATVPEGELQAAVRELLASEVRR